MGALKVLPVRYSVPSMMDLGSVETSPLGMYTTFGGFPAHQTGHSMQRVISYARASRTENVRDAVHDLKHCLHLDDSLSDNWVSLEPGSKGLRERHRWQEN